MNINGLFLAFEFDLLKKTKINSTESGIEKKIFYQYKTFSDYNFNMAFYNPYKINHFLEKRIRRRMPFSFLNKWDESEVNLSALSFEYIRKPWRLDGDLILHLRRLKKKNPKCIVIMEIPTYPYDNENYTFSSIPLVLKDKFWRKRLHNYVDRIVTYSNDNSIFGIQTIRISNAINVNNDYSYIKKSFNPLEIHVMMCATLCYWHGYDRAIEGLYNYYQNGGETNYILHIVGYGDEYPKYKELIEKYNLQKHIIMHGKLYGSELDKVYSLCDIGFDSMGRHRSGVVYNSSLKGKEYASKGLPIVSGVCTEFDYITNYKYYYRVPADDSPIDFTKITSFCSLVFSGADVPSTHKAISEYANLHFSYESTMKPVIEYISKNSI